MRQKVSTVLDGILYRRVKLEAVRQGRQISDILDEALSDYLSARRTPGDIGGVTEQSWGVLWIEHAMVDAILEEEDGLFDA